MIDFDEIECEEKKSLDELTVVLEHQQREEEERQRKEEALRFKLELALEQEIERRSQVTEAELAEDRQGILGVSLTNSSGDKFVDALNACLLTIGRLFAKHRSEHPSVIFLQCGLAALVAYLNALFLCRFNAGGVAVHLEQLQRLLSRPKSGLCAQLQEAMARHLEGVAQPWQSLAPCLNQVLACLARTQCWAMASHGDIRLALAKGHTHICEFFKELIGEVPQPTWPVVDSPEAIEIRLFFSEAEEGVPVKVKPNLTALQLRNLLVECCYCPPLISLSLPGRREELPGDVKARALRLGVAVHGCNESQKAKPGSDAVEGAEHEEKDLAGEDSDGEGDNTAGERHQSDMEVLVRVKDCVAENLAWVERVLFEGSLPPDVGTVSGVGWVTRWHVLRTTPLTGTRLLLQLRQRFQAVEFQEAYKELKMRMRHVDFALQVQLQVLPKFGFADSISGVNDMRSEITTHEMHHSDLAVEKLRREIHGLLEYGEPPRRVPVTRALEPPRFRAQQTSEWRRHLAEEGYAVISGVATQGEVARAYELLWDFIEASDVRGIIRRKDLRTWCSTPGRDRGWPGERDDGIIHTRGIGQSEVLWYLRTLPELQRVFANVWGTEDLVTSFDGAGVFRPYGQFEGWRTTKKNWFHVDQTHKRRGLHCVQGLLNLKHASRATGGLVVVPGSHRLYGDLLRRYQEPGSQDSLHLDVTDPILTEGDTGPRLICAEAGDLIIWDSRTVHCNTPPLVDDPQLLNGDDLLRAVAYICMTPAEWCSHDVCDSKLAAAQAGITTTHVPHAYRPMDIPERFPAPQITAERRRLILGREQRAGTQGLGGEDTRPGNFSQTLAPGIASLLPAQRFQVSGTAAPVRGSATLEWGSAVGSLACGSVVAGFTFGQWLRLNEWPEGALSEAGKSHHEEFWVPLKWKDGCMQLSAQGVQSPTSL